MIYDFDFAFCAVSAFFFKNFFTFAGFLLLAYFIFKYFIQKLSNITVILYFLLIFAIFAGGVVISLIPSKEDILCPTMVNSFYLGPVILVLLVSLFISIIVDLIRKIVKEEKTEEKPKKVRKKVTVKKKKEKK